MKEVLMNSITLEVQMSVEEVSDLIDTAGYSMNYWATAGQYDDETQTYTVTIDEEARDAVEWDTNTKTITYAEITAAVKALINGSVSVNKGTVQSLIAEFITKDAGMIDSDDAECVIQVALFGDIIFG